MLPLLHFSRSRVAVSSSSAPAFGAFAPGSSCHLRFHQPQALRRRLVSRFPVGSGRFSGLFATPRFLTATLIVARRSRSATRLPSCFRAPRFNLSSALPRNLSRAVLTLTVPTTATGPVTSFEKRLQHLSGQMHPCVLCARPTGRHGLRSHLRSNLRSSALVCVTTPSHIPRGPATSRQV
jgi:hypothetical protein